ncbi:MAG: pilus assembly protein PilM [Halothiobacillaceae bacterium]|nr:MAG: pilus assembly protein PilM [Halothiobacillaceae bacterium]
MFRRARKQPLLGLDISSTAVKLIELSRTRDAYRIEALAIEGLPERAVQDKTIMDPEAVGGAIRKLVKDSGTRSKRAAIAVPGSVAVSRVVTVPANLSETELEIQIRMEADQYVPYPLEEVSLDFDIIGPTPGNPGTIDVLMAATRTENLESRVAAAELGGLQVDIVDIEPFAIENAFQELLKPRLSDISPDMGVALLDIGATVTGLSVFHQGAMIYTREHPFGGRQHTDEIMRRFQMSYAEASRAKRQGGLPESYASEVKEPFLELAAQQASRFLQFFYAAHPNVHLMQILVGGGVAAMPELADRIATSTGIETKQANPLMGMSRAARVPSRMVNEDAAAMLIACGLALRSFD